MNGVEARVANERDSVRLREMDELRVAFQGELGAFSEEAVRMLFPDSVVPVPYREFREVGDAVVAADVDYGLLPVENTLAGSVVGSYDVLADKPIEVVSEVIAPIHHCLLAQAGATLEDIRQVHSHPVALAQCTRFLLEHPAVQAVAVYDTAGAAREVAALGDPTVAAIAGRQAAERYGLHVLVTDIEDRHDNQTRFLVIARPNAPAPPRRATAPAGIMKTALLVETDNAPGALVQVLLPLANRGVNLSKLESRPGTEPWSYRFFIEMEADTTSAVAREALAEIRRRARFLRVVGTYPKWAAT